METKKKRYYFWWIFRQNFCSFSLLLLYFAVRTFADIFILLAFQTWSLISGWFGCEKNVRSMIKEKQQKIDERMWVERRSEWEREREKGRIVGGYHIYMMKNSHSTSHSWRVSEQRLEADKITVITMSQNEKGVSII